MNEERAKAALKDAMAKGREEGQKAFDTLDEMDGAKDGTVGKKVLIVVGIVLVVGLVLGLVLKGCV